MKWKDSNERPAGGEGGGNVKQWELFFSQVGGTKRRSVADMGAETIVFGQSGYSSCLTGKMFPYSTVLSISYKSLFQDCHTFSYKSPATGSFHSGYVWTSRKKNCFHNWLYWDGWGEVFVIFSCAVITSTMSTVAVCLKDTIVCGRWIFTHTKSLVMISLGCWVVLLWRLRCVTCFVAVCIG